MKYKTTYLVSEGGKLGIIPEVSEDNPTPQVMAVVERGQEIQVSILCKTSNDLKTENESLKHLLHGFAFYLDRLQTAIDENVKDGLESLLAHYDISDINDLYACIETDEATTDHIDPKYIKPIDWNESYMGVAKNREQEQRYNRCITCAECSEANDPLVCGINGEPIIELDDCPEED